MTVYFLQFFLFFMGKTLAQNPFPKSQTTSPSIPLTGISLYPKINELFNICALIGFSLFCALLSC